MAEISYDFDHTGLMANEARKGANRTNQNVKCFVVHGFATYYMVHAMRFLCTYKYHFN